jgi:CubicO group peptidase (beta-lactamase class C family)
MIKKDEIDKLVEEAIQTKIFPGCVIGVVEKKDESMFIQKVLAYGTYEYNADSKKVSGQSIFDVASLTKTISTGLISMKLLEKGKIFAKDPVQKFFPQFHDLNTTVFHLLTYTVPFKAFTKEEKENFNINLSLEDFRENLFRIPFDGEVGAKYLYSDATADLLGRIIEKVTNKSLEENFQELVGHNLELVNSSLEPKKFPKESIIPSQIINGEIVQGVVNDPKARKNYLGSHYSGCAGLFSNISDCLKVLEMFLDFGMFRGQRFLERESILKMVDDNLSLVLPTPMCTGDNSVTSLKKLFPDRKLIFGKSGFTGCLLLGDLESGKAFVFLSNRTYPNGDKEYEKYATLRQKLVKLILN